MMVQILTSRKYGTYPKINKKYGMDPKIQNYESPRYVFRHQKSEKCLAEEFPKDAGNGASVLGAGLFLEQTKPERNIPDLSLP